MREYKTEILGIPTIDTERGYQLQRLAQEYHERTEAFDQSVCSYISPRTGLAMPVNSHEFGLIQQSARMVSRQICAEAAQFGIAPDEMISSIRHYRFRRK